MNRSGMPLARSEGLLVEELGEETVIFDTESKDVHCLSPLAAAVFASCDGSNSLESLAAAAGSRVGETVDVERVDAALAQLEERDLLAPLPGGISRRTLVRRTAVATAALTAAPMITSIVTPAHAQIISPTPGCPRGVCSSQSEGDPFCNQLGCPDPEGKPRDSCECELCCILLDQGRVASCPYTCDGTTPVNPPRCPPGSSPANPGPGGCEDASKHLDGVCIQRPGDTSEPCFDPDGA